MGDVSGNCCEKIDRSFSHPRDEQFIILIFLFSSLVLFIVTKSEYVFDVKYTHSLGTETSILFTTLYPQQCANTHRENGHEIGSNDIQQAYCDCGSQPKIEAVGKKCHFFYVLN